MPLGLGLWVVVVPVQFLRTMSRWYYVERLRERLMRRVEKSPLLLLLVQARCQ